MIDIYRFSEDGFTPKLQSNIIQDILFWREYTGFRYHSKVPNQTFRENY